MVDVNLVADPKGCWYLIKIMDIETGLTVKLTNAKTPNSLWRPRLQEPGYGVRDLLSAFNTVTNEAIYFNSNEIRALNIHTRRIRVQLPKLYSYRLRPGGTLVVL